MRITASIAAITGILTALPAAAVVLPVGAYTATYSIYVGGSNITGSGTGFNQQLLGRSYGDSTISIAPVAALGLHGHSEGMFQTVFADAQLQYDYNASFTASSSRYASSNLQPIMVSGFTQVLASGFAQVYTTIGDLYISCNQDPFTDNCGAHQFLFNLSGDSVSATNLGGGLSRYTVSGTLQLSAHVTAFGNAGLISSGRAYVDPLIQIDSAFAADVGATDTSIELSPGVANASAPPPGVPEPASWAMLIAGFGLTGAMARRRLPRRVAA